MTEQEIRSCMEQLRRKDAALEQVELLLYRMHQLAEYSMLEDNHEQIDRQQLQAELDSVKARIEQVLADVREEPIMEDGVVWQ